MVRQIFKGRAIATAGPLPGQLTVENLKRWTELRKGYFSEDFDDNVTHLLCTREQFNKKVPRVKEALRRGKRFHIVHYDWFEFSTVNEKRLPEREFSMRNILAKQNAAKREQARIERGIKNGEKFVNTNLFHIYCDREYFSYKIDITRDDEDSGEVGQRWTLCLWESNAQPHLYQFTAKFLKKKGNSQPSYYRPSPCSGKWRTEMDLFMQFFETKTGINWEDRVTMELTKPSSKFQYAPPRGGKPVGRRLRFNYEYCRQINAELRGLPWPPPEEVASQEEEEVAADDGPVSMDYDEAINEYALGFGDINEQDGHTSEAEEDEKADNDQEMDLQPSQETTKQENDEDSQYFIPEPDTADTLKTNSTCSTPSGIGESHEKADLGSGSGEEDCIEGGGIVDSFASTDSSPGTTQGFNQIQEVKNEEHPSYAISRCVVEAC